MEESKKLKKHFLIAFFVVLAIAAVLLIVGFATELGILGFFALITIFAAVIVGIVGIVRVINAKKAEKKLNDPNSIASKTYGGTGNYAFFKANIGRGAQTARNAAVNTLGVLGMIFGGGGVFVAGHDVFDVFVSPEEILINNKNKNLTFEDSKFQRIHSSNIKAVNYESLKAYERVIISFIDGGKDVVIDVMTGNNNDRTPIRNAFNLLINKTE